MRYVLSKTRWNSGSADLLSLFAVGWAAVLEDPGVVVIFRVKFLVCLPGVVGGASCRLDGESVENVSSWRDS